MKFSVACKSFFGFLPGTGLQEFFKELKQLTPQDKQEIAAGLRQNGMVIDEPVE